MAPRLKRPDGPNSGRSLSALRLLQHGGIERRYGKKERWAVALRGFEDRFRLRLVGKQHGGCTHMKREHQPVAEAVGVEEFGRGERYVVRADIQYAAAVILRKNKPNRGADAPRLLVGQCFPKSTARKRCRPC